MGLDLTKKQSKIEKRIEINDLNRKQIQVYSRQIASLYSPERRAPPKGCCPTIDPVDLSLM